ncbi:Polyferredoxin NapH (periplasmic nitrate reductase) [hydrothermal vent metagenome]|uniref:Polyferredoxin NapH (Periplasmic nitrate reductase) n=1 Tax=hydrothermal vent metagenome TaxID=652676 RepID=A0A3B1AT16_9ZZZZ
MKASSIHNLQSGQSAIEAKGWLLAHKWLLLRRSSQLGIVGLFLLGPLAGIWLVKGNLASSLVLDTLPLSDPYLLLQSIMAGHLPEVTALSGALIVMVFYLVVGGRSYCAWVCPLNMVTDTARYLRDRWKLKGGAHVSRQARYWLLAMSLLLALFTGNMAWELINPVSMVQRGLFFGMGAAWLFVGGLFIFDLFISRQGWCGHLCPVGAFYSLLGAASVVRVSANGRTRCDDCMDCFAVCPEQQVIRPALKGADKNISPIIFSGNCTNCGRCIDVCAQDVFKFSHRYEHSRYLSIDGNKEVRS